jgi:putative transposase
VLAGLGRSSCRYRHRRRHPAELVARLRELAAAKPRYGYRFLHTLLRREGHAVNRKRVYRLYRAEGLAVRRRKRRRLRVSRPMPSVLLRIPVEGGGHGGDPGR